MEDEPIDLHELTSEDMHTIPDEHFAAVGKVVDACAGMDLGIDYMIWELLGVDQLQGACVTSQMISIHSRMKALIALAMLNGAEKAAEELRSLYGELSGLAEKRNRLLHDKRMVNYHTKEVNRLNITTKRALEFGTQIETIDYLLKFASDMHDKVDKFDGISARLRSEILTSPKTPSASTERVFRLPHRAETPDQ